MEIGKGKLCYPFRIKEGGDSNGSHTNNITIDDGVNTPWIRTKSADDNEKVSKYGKSSFWCTKCKRWNLFTSLLTMSKRVSQPHLTTIPLRLLELPLQLQLLRMVMQMLQTFLLKTRLHHLTSHS